jgi:hypothetical protein
MDCGVGWEGAGSTGLAGGHWCGGVDGRVGAWRGVGAGQGRGGVGVEVEAGAHGVGVGAGQGRGAMATRSGRRRRPRGGDGEHGQPGGVDELGVVEGQMFDQN